MATHRISIHLDDEVNEWLCSQPRTYNFSEDVRTMLRLKYNIRKNGDDKHDNTNRTIRIPNTSH